MSAPSTLQVALSPADGAAGTGVAETAGVGWTVPAGIEGAVEEGAAEGAAEDATEEGTAEVAAELVGGYPVIVPGFEVCIDDATGFGAVLGAPLAAPQIEVNGPPAETISTSEPGLG